MILNFYLFARKRRRIKKRKKIHFEKKTFRGNNFPRRELEPRQLSWNPDLFSEKLSVKVCILLGGVMTGFQ
jgi:hypothetical protein